MDRELTATPPHLSSRRSIAKERSQTRSKEKQKDKEIKRYAMKANSQ